MVEPASALYLTGVFGVVLGGMHFFFPLLFDFEHAIPRDGGGLGDLKPFRLLFIRYATRRSDVRGIAWVMNYFVSYNLVAYGVADLLWRSWLHTTPGTALCLWMAGGWLVRAGTQLYLGRRRVDWLLLALFGAVGAIHLALAVVLTT